MSEAFLKIVNMSISAGWLVLAVLALRLILKKAPKWVNVLLWGIVAVRLLCPISIESALSLIPSTQTISPEIMMDHTPEITTGIPALNNAINPIISDSFAPNPGDSANPLQILIPVAANIWILGMLVLLLYTAISYFSLRRKLRTATILRDNVYQCVAMDSPFVLGILRPKIYLPYRMEGQDLEHVVAHEIAHIRRKDHWWKPLGFLLLTVHWFNPLMWSAYILLCRDIELACDEKVIKEMGNEQRADYTQALVHCSVSRRMIAACPLAFGEVGVKDRVRSIMNYRKPTFWIMVTAVVACVAVAVCFLTDPKPTPKFSMNGDNIRDLEPARIVERIIDYQDIENSNVYMNANNFSLTVDANFDWVDFQAIRYFFYENHKVRSAQLRIFPNENEYFLTESGNWPDQNRIFLLQHYLDAIKYLPQEAIRELAPADQYLIEHIDGGNPSDYDRVITYSSQGVGETDGWYLHLRILPQHSTGDAYSGTGEEVVHLFYGDSAGSGAKMWFDYTSQPELLDWNQDREYTAAEFPGVTFRCNPYEITVGERVLIQGMPIWSAYLSDLNGDGYPEICAETSFGSGMIDNRIVIYDYANSTSYLLEDRGRYDYHLRKNDGDGRLYADKWIYNSDVLVSSKRLSIEDSTVQYQTGPVLILMARLLDIEDEQFLVEPVEGSPELNSARRIMVPMRNMAPSPEPVIGDILQIEYDGLIQETYPARITNVYRISVAERNPDSQE